MGDCKQGRASGRQYGGKLTVGLCGGRQNLSIWDEFLIFCSLWKYLDNVGRAALVANLVVNFMRINENMYIKITFLPH